MSANRPDTDNLNIQRAHFYSHSDITGFLQTKGQLIGTNDNGTGIGNCTRIAAPTTDFQALLAASDMEGGANWQTLGSLSLADAGDFTITGSPTTYVASFNTDTTLTFSSTGGATGPTGVSIQTAYDNSTTVSDVPVLTLDNAYRGLDIKNNSTPVTENYAMLFSVLPNAYTGSDGVDQTHFAVQSDNVMGLNSRVSNLTGGGNFVMGGADNAVTTGVNNVLMGIDTTAGGVADNSVVIGTGAMATTDSTVAIGTEADADGDAAVAIGASNFGVDSGPTSSNEASIAIGSYSSAADAPIASGIFSVAIGSGSNSFGANSVSFGNGKTAATATDAISIGSSFSTARYGISIGENANASDTTSIAVGDNTVAYDTSIAIGSGVSAIALNSIGIGNDQTGNVSNSDSISIGDRSLSAGSSRAISIGYLGGTIEVPRGVVIGKNVIDANGPSDVVVIGHDNRSSDATTSVVHDLIQIGRNNLFANTGGGLRNIIIGSGNMSNAVINDLIMIGRGNITSDGVNTNQIIIGSGNRSSASSNEAVIIGSNSNNAPSVDNNVVIGDTATTSAGNTISMGRLASAAPTSSVAIGDSAVTVTGDDTIAIGPGATARGISAIAIGHDAMVSDADYGIAIGQGSVVNNEYGIALGALTEVRPSDSADEGGIAINFGAQCFDGRGICIGKNSVLVSNSDTTTESVSIGQVSVVRGDCLCVIGEDHSLGKTNPFAGSIGGSAFAKIFADSTNMANRCDYSMILGNGAYIDENASYSIVVGDFNISQQIPQTTIWASLFMAKRDSFREVTLIGDRFTSYDSTDTSSTLRQTSPSTQGTGASADGTSDAFIRFSTPYMSVMSPNIEISQGGGGKVFSFPTNGFGNLPTTGPAGTPPLFADATCEFFIDEIYAIQVKNGDAVHPGGYGGFSGTTSLTITTTPAVGIGVFTVGGTDVGVRFPAIISDAPARGITSISITLTPTVEATDSQFVRVYFKGTLVEDARMA